MTKPTFQKITSHPKDHRRLLLSDGRPVLAVIGGGHAISFTPDEMEQISAHIVACWNATIKPHWIAASEKLPDDDLCVLIALADGEVWTGFYDAGQWRYVSADPVEGAVTHWMDFPEPPNAEITARPKAVAG